MDARGVKKSQGDLCEAPPRTPQPFLQTPALFIASLSTVLSKILKTKIDGKSPRDSACQFLTRWMKEH